MPRGADQPASAELSGSVQAKFGDYLVSNGKLAQSGVDRVLTIARESHEHFETIITQLGLLSERDLVEALAGYLSLPVASESNFPATPILEERLGREFLKKRQFIPISEDADSVTIAMARPLDTQAIAAVRFATGKTVVGRIASFADFDAAHERLYGGGGSAFNKIEAAAKGRTETNSEEDIDRLKDIASEAPVIRLVNMLIARAVEEGASDIHIEPMESELRIRYRIDGVLRKVDSPSVQLSSAVLSRIKIMAKLNIAERRVPQDGRIGVAVRGHDIDVRVAISPTIYGERATLRILDRSRMHLDLADLGYDQSIADELRKALIRPHGIFLVTGPTGSGKTTTLYAVLLELNKIETNILTIEDPVEYQLAGVSQVQVKPQIGLTFAHALRSFLRQDPDIMMVGEIRDLETAQIAVQAALTGHLILSTVHTNDAASTITRLLDMGIEDYLLSSTMNGIVAQRLVKTLCPRCREAFQPPPELISRLELDHLSKSDSPILYRPRGCENCMGSGYRGRSTIAEVLTISDEIRDAMMKSSDAGQIQKIAVRSGMETMRSHGLRKALAGMTTVEEVMRATRVV